MPQSGKTLAELVSRHNFGRASRGAGWPSMFVMTDEKRLPDPISIVPGLPRGCAMILRHYQSPNRSQLAAALAPVCRVHGVPLLIAGDAALAYRVKADGLHLPAAALRRAWQRKRCWYPPSWLITAAAHSSAELRWAAKAGADAALLAPVFPTASHPGTKNLGVLRFTGLTFSSPLPVYALGGLEASNVGRLIHSRVAGIAGISGFTE